MSREITLYGAACCPDCRRVKKLLAEPRIPYVWIDTEKDKQAQAVVSKLNACSYRVPTLVLPGGDVLTEPGNAELMPRPGITSRASKPFYDVIIVGGGPAGLTAAVYSGRYAVSTLIIDRAGLGCQAGLTSVGTVGISRRANSTDIGKIQRVLVGFRRGTVMLRTRSVRKERVS